MPDLFDENLKLGAPLADRMRPANCLFCRRNHLVLSNYYYVTIE